MKNKLVALFATVRHVGKRIERQVKAYVTRLRHYLLTLRDDLAEAAMVRQEAREARMRSSYNMPAWLAHYLAALSVVPDQAGYSLVGVLGGGVIVIALAILVIQKGIPQIYTITANSTAMTAVGMSTDQVQYWNWGMWAIVLAVVFACGGLIFKKYGMSGVGGGGGGGGGDGGRRRRR